MYNLLIIKYLKLTNIILAHYSIKAAKPRFIFDLTL